MRRNSSLGSVGFSARGGRSRRRHGGSSKLPYLILIGILIVLLGIAAFLWVRRSPAAHVSSVPASTETDSENGVISLIMHLHLLMTASRVSSLRQSFWQTVMTMTGQSISCPAVHTHLTSP